MKSVHLVCSPELIMLLSRSLEHEGYVISGKHSTLHSFISGFSSKEVDPSSIVIMEGGAGLGTPVKAADIISFMTLIRKYLKHTRLIVQLDPVLQTDIEFIRTLVNMNIHDLQFTTEFQGDDLLNWIKEKKTTRDYYHILGKKKGLLHRLKAHHQEQLLTRQWKRHRLLLRDRWSRLPVHSQWRPVPEL